MSRMLFAAAALVAAVAAGPALARGHALRIHAFHAPRPHHPGHVTHHRVGHRMFRP